MKTLTIALTATIIFASLAAPVLAQTLPFEDTGNDCGITDIWCGTGKLVEGGHYSCNKSIYDREGKLVDVNPCDFCDGLIVVRNVTVMLIWFSGIAALIMIAVGALLMMFAAGSEERFAKGKTAMLNALIGLGIALGAWLVVNFVLHFLSGNPDLPWNSIDCA